MSIGADAQTRGRSEGHAGAAGRRLLVGAALVTVVLSHPLAARAYIYWSRAGVIGRSANNGSDVIQRLITTPANEGGSMTIGDGHLYWTSANGGTGSTIGRANLDGSDFDASFINTGPINDCGVAVTTTSIYWVGDNGSYIGRASVDGSNVDRSFLDVGPGSCQLAISGPYLYWAAYRNNEIGRAKLDGSDVDMHFIPTIGAGGITIEGNYIYWANNNGTIGRATLAGADVDQSFVKGAAGAAFMAADSSHLYWAVFDPHGVSGDGSTIGRASLDGTDVDEQFVHAARGVFGVAVDSAGPVAASAPSPATTPSARLGVLTGVVQRAAGGVVTQAQVVVCNSTRGCESTRSASNGRYRLTGLASGSWQAQVYPPSATLFGGSATVTITAGATTTADFALAAPTPLSAGLTVSSPLGSERSGLATAVAGKPLLISYPARIQRGSSAGEILYVTRVTVTQAGTATPRTPLASGSEAVLLAPGPSGPPRVVSVMPLATGATVPTVRIAHRRGGILLRAATATPASDASALRALVTLRPTRTFLTYIQTASGSAASAETTLTQPGSDTVQVGQNTLHVPAGSTVTVSGSTITVTTPVGSTPPADCSVSCQPTTAAGAITSSADLSVDPIGTVETTAGAPLAGATVSLTHALQQAGPFVAVPGGSSDLSSADRRNPVTTSSAGAFGWDVLPGIYRIDATHPGCHATSGGATVSSPVLIVPPEPANVVLQLSCPKLHRDISHLTLSVTHQGTTTLLSATVSGASRSPSGTITFTANSASVGAVSLNPRTHRAAIIISGAIARTYGATYSGDAYATSASTTARP